LVASYITLVFHYFDGVTVQQSRHQQFQYQEDHSLS